MFELQHFLAIIKLSIDMEVAIVPDRHSTHTTNLETVELARENIIFLLSVPPHTTHRLQHLDVSF
jgi:hypothetical protein